MNPLISVILPVYRSEKYIKNCLNSIVNQTYNNIEIIVVSDGCIDSSIAIAEEILSGSSRPYKILSQPNQGVASARNNGIKYATGEWIIAVDSDDCLYTDTFSLLMSNINDENVATFDYENNQPLDRAYSVKQSDILHVRGYEMLHRYYSREYDIVAPALLIKKSLLSTNAIVYDEGCLFAEDDLYVWKVLSIVDGVLYIKLPFYNYIFHSGSTMTTSSIEKFKSVKKHALALQTAFIQNSPNAYGLGDKITYRFFIGVLHVAAKLHSYSEFKLLIDHFELNNRYRTISNRMTIQERVLFALPIYVPRLLYVLFRNR